MSDDLTEPIDEQALHDALHAHNSPAPDLLTAKAVFVHRRRQRDRRRRMLAIAAGSAASITVTLVAYAVISSGQPTTTNDAVGFAGGSPTTEGDVVAGPPEPAGTESPDPNATADELPPAPVPTVTPLGSKTPKPSSTAGGVASSGPAQTGQPTPEPTSSAGECKEVESINPAESSGCYIVRVGKKIQVSYDESYWSNPETSDEKVLKTGETTHVQCVRAPCYGQMTDFHGNSVGTAKLSAYGDPCKDNPPDQPMCGAPVQLWEVTVHVLK